MQTRKPILILAVLVVLAVAPAFSFAQYSAAPPFTPEQLDKLAARIALYPDSLLAQVLAAATYSDQIPDAARWPDQHHDLTGQAWLTRSKRIIFRGIQACRRCCHSLRCSI